MTSHHGTVGAGSVPTAHLQDDSASCDGGSARRSTAVRDCQPLQFTNFFLPLDESGPYSGRPTYKCTSGNALTRLRLPLCFRLMGHRSLSIRYRALVLDGLVCVFVCACVAAPNKHRPVQPHPLPDESTIYAAQSTM